MSIIREYFTQAELALAAYTNLYPGISDASYISALQNDGNGMSLKQAESFASRWRVIEQYPGLMGLSATVFEDTADGKRYLAVRGTDITDPKDIVEDGGILFNGLPGSSDQYQDLKSQIEKWQQSNVLPDSFTVAGHSLGGWLAGALAAEFAGNIEHAYLYNAPGVFGWTGELIDQFNQVFGTEFLSIDLSNISNIRASVGVSPIAGLGQALAPVVGIEIEDHQLGNHRMKYLTDALAVYNLFANVDSSVDVETIGNIFMASSNESHNRMEAVVSALGELLVAGFTSRKGIAYDNDRDALYTDIETIATALSESSALTIEALGANDSDGTFTPFSPYQIETLAKDDIAFRYALGNLNSFAVLGADYQGFNQNGELDLYDPNTGQGQLSNMYLVDRAAMLANLIYCNNHDTIDAGGDGLPILFTDIRADGENLSISAGKHEILLDQARYTFGSKEGDPHVTGTSNNDRLYGMGGNDTLSGYGGNDYIEGGVGEDTLIGGEGDDTLVGGDGIDTYVINSGDGHDTIIDTGRNIIRKDGKTFTGVFTRIADTNFYEFTSDDGNYTVTFNSPGHLVFDDDTTLTFQNQTSPESLKESPFGIYLVEENSPEKTLSLIGTDENDESSLVSIDGQHYYQFGGSATIEVDETTTLTVSGGAGEDYLVGLPGTDHLQGGAGDDYFVSNGMVNVVDSAGDLMEGGDGNDVFQTTDEIGSTFYCGRDNDSVAGYRGDDIAYGEAGTDVLTGDSGGDYLSGGADNDLLLGDHRLSLVGEVPGENNVEFTYDDQKGFITSYTPIDYYLMKDGDSYVWNGTEITFDIPAGDDYLDGGSGKDFLDGGGGEDILVGGEGQDTLVGGDGDDLLDGGQGADLLIGDRGDDTGTVEGADILYGGDGDDQLQGGLGDDILHGENDADLLFGQEGDDYLYGGSEDDELQGNEGDDVLYGEEGDDLLFGQEGNDILDGGIGSDQLQGGDGNDVLYGGVGSDTLFGDDGDDTLHGGDGNDILLPGVGNDTLDGGLGNDTYFFSLGTGVKHLTDSGGDDLLVLNDISLSNIKLSKGSLAISSKAAEGTLHLDGVDYDNLVETSPIDRIRFSGGEEMSIAEVVEAVGIDYETTEGGDTISGTSARDNIAALGGDDVVETGAGNDIIDLGAGDDIADAGSGDDYLDGGHGIDTLIGGAGDDLYRVDHADDQIIEAADEGHDRVESEVSYTLSEHVEELSLAGSQAISGTGNEQDNRIIGNANDNCLEGLAGNDTLDGQDGTDQLLGGDGEDLLIGGGGDDLLDGGAGADIMQGGSGDDLYQVDDKNDQIEENSNQGYDRVESAASYQLNSNLEELQLTGTDNLSGWGNDADNWIIGNAGDNYLDGLGGDDVLEGGEGNDTYRINTMGDSVIENAGEGVDTVESGFDYTLDDNVENLVLTGAAHNGTGNDLDNHLVGNAGANRLDGGIGADLLEGGGGNDTYVVEQENDQIVEAVNGGTDQVESSLSFTLAENVENLTLTGTNDLNGTGNDLDNRILGNKAVNVLSGAAGSDALFGLGGEDRVYGGAGNDMLDGGTGADLMAGGLGNDSYHVDSEADQIVENLGEGTDQAFSTVSYALSENVENLTLAGSADIDGAGNALDNEIIGNLGNNILAGGAGNDYLDGGYGSDIVYGGAGDDFYRVDRADDQIIETAGEGYDQVESEVSYTLSDHVEQLFLVGSNAFDGTGNAQDNRIIGNNLDNNLDGQGGNDYLDGAAGDDILLGDEGDDVLYGGDDAMKEGGGDSGGYYRFAARAMAIAPGGDELLSNNDYLDGGAGNDDLDGGSGDDILFGGEGDDVLYGGDDGLNGGNGDSGGFYSLTPMAMAAIIAPGGNGGNLTNDDYLDGGSGDDSLAGGSGDDTLLGEDGVDSLVGGTGDDLLDGGTGIDVMAGGTGNDVYYVDGYTEVTVIHGDCHPGQGHGHDCGSPGNDRPKGNEGVGNGCDLPPPGHDHNCNDGPGTAPGQPGMQGGGHCGTQNISKSHNGTDKRKETNHCEQDKGDCGDIHDSCFGDIHQETRHDHQSEKEHGHAFDCYPHKCPGGEDWPGGHGKQVIINHVTDTVIEEADSGYDVVYSSITYDLTENVEELHLTGTDNLDGTGNDLDNSIIGNDGDNRLDGGFGRDWLFGGLGNDTYQVDNPEDSIKENLGEGDDRVEASCDYVLSENLERLALLGSADLNGSGNQIDNELIGNAGANVLQGLAGDDTLEGGAGNDNLTGGTGDDTLFGGAGSDLYLFEKGAGHDQVVEVLSGIGWWDHNADDEDVIRFGEGINKQDVAFLSRWGSLQIGYGEGDQVDVMPRGFGRSGIERIELADGSYLTDADLNQLIQQMAAFAVDEGIAMNSLDDIRNNQELMALVANAWHTA